MERALVQELAWVRTKGTRNITWICFFCFLSHLACLGSVRRHTNISNPSTMLWKYLFQVQQRTPGNFQHIHQCLGVLMQQLYPCNCNDLELGYCGCKGFLMGICVSMWQHDLGQSCFPFPCLEVFINGAYPRGRRAEVTSPSGYMTISLPGSYGGGYGFTRREKSNFNLKLIKKKHIGTISHG